MKGIVGGSISKEDIQDRVRELAREIDNSYKRAKNTKPVLVIGVLNGAFIFTADLIRELEMDVQVEFCKIQSYKNNNRSTDISISIQDIEESRDILIVEDIVDSGNSIKSLLRALEKSQPSSVKICSLLKRHTCKDINLDFIGFELVDDSFVVGYGMDYNNTQRGNDCIFNCKEEL